MKIKSKVTLKTPNNSNVIKLSLLILTDENNNHWLLPFRPELDIVKPGKKNKELFEVSKATAYNIQEWMDDDAIDETIHQLILGPNLYKMDSQPIEGEITLKILLCPATGEFRIDIDQEITAPLLVTNYDVHAIHSNQNQRKVL
jgi:hypothetical protein